MKEDQENKGKDLSHSLLKVAKYAVGLGVPAAWVFKASSDLEEEKDGRFEGPPTLVFTLGMILLSGFMGLLKYNVHPQIFYKEISDNAKIVKFESNHLRGKESNGLIYTFFPLVGIGRDLASKDVLYFKDSSGKEYGIEARVLRFDKKSGDYFLDEDVLKNFDKQRFVIDDKPYPPNLDKGFKHIKDKVKKELHLLVTGLNSKYHNYRR